MSSIQTEYFKIRTAEIDQHKRLHPYALIQLMQEASMQHTISMKVSVWDMETMKASWVLLKMEVDIISYPLLNETIKVETYPSGLDGYFTYRDYFVYDPIGNLCATATTMWTLINTDTRKMIKIPESFGSLVYVSDRPLGKPVAKIKPVGNNDNATEIKINYFHLDWNGHTNNVQLIKIMLEGMENHFLKENTLKSIHLQFKSEALMDQSVIVNYEKTEIENYIHTIKDKDTQKDILLAQTIWTVKTP